MAVRVAVDALGGDNAPEEIVAKERERVAALQQRRGVLKRHIDTLRDER